MKREVRALFLYVRIVNKFFNKTEGRWDIIDHKKMKKHLFLLTIGLTLLFSACSENSPINIKSYGTIQCVNNTSDPYYVNINGNTPLSFTLEGHHYVTKTVETGYYNVHIKQKNGYLIYPTEKDYSFYVNANENKLVSF